MIDCSDGKCEAKESAMPCPKCGKRMMNIFKVKKDDGKVMPRPKLLETVCEGCGYSRKPNKIIFQLSQ